MGTDCPKAGELVEDAVPGRSRSKATDGTLSARSTVSRTVHACTNTLSIFLSFTADRAEFLIFVFCLPPGPHWPCFDRQACSENQGGPRAGTSLQQHAWTTGSTVLLAGPPAGLGGLRISFK